MLLVHSPLLYDTYTLQYNTHQLDKQIPSPITSETEEVEVIVIVVVRLGKSCSE